LPASACRSNLAGTIDHVYEIFSADAKGKANIEEKPEDLGTSV